MLLNDILIYHLYHKDIYVKFTYYIVKMTENLNDNPNERLYVSAANAFWELKKTMVPWSKEFKFEGEKARFVNVITEPVIWIPEFIPASSMCVHDDEIYAATKKGILKVHPEEERYENFLDIDVQKMASLEDRMYAASSDRVYEVDKKGNVKDTGVKRDSKIYTLCSSYGNLYDLTDEGIYLTLEDKKGENPLIESSRIRGMFSMGSVYYTTFSDSYEDLEICDMGKRAERRQHPCKTKVFNLEDRSLFYTFYNYHGVSMLSFDDALHVVNHGTIENLKKKEEEC